MTKTEQIYKMMLKKKVVNMDDLTAAAEKILRRHLSRVYVHNEYIRKLMQQKKLLRIRQGLYLVLAPLETPKSFSMDKILIASKIRTRYYLGYHTALEFYGCAYSVYNETYVCIRKQDRFDAFEYGRQRFMPVFTKDIIGGVEVKKYSGQKIYVSSRERTFLDCIGKPKYVGGWEECLKSLEGLSGINRQKIYRLLRKFDNDFLYRKAGFVLELLRRHSVHYEWVNDELLTRMKERIGCSPMYIERKPSVLNRNWNLYVPKKFEGLLRGV